jgi:hypothetical protein
LGTVFGSNSELYARFQEHYRSLVKDGSVAEQSSAGNYDAAYLLAYATVAAGRTITGATLSQGLTRAVASGMSINVGPEQIGDAFSALLAGQSIDFKGATGAYNFDVTAGEPAGDIQIWCVDVDNGVADGFVNSGLYYSAATKMMQGTFSCP